MLMDCLHGEAYGFGEVVKDGIVNGRVGKDTVEKGEVVKGMVYDEE